MNFRRLLPTLMAATLIGSLASAAPAYADGAPVPPILSVGGEVNTATQYTISQLAALPQTSATIGVGPRQVTVSGVLLETLVLAAGPKYPGTLLNFKNELLRVTATVRGADHRAVTLALGELDPSFGNHPALLALAENGHRVTGGPLLAVPRDGAPLREVWGVSSVTVGIATAVATDTTPLPASPVEVIDGTRQVTLSAALLARVPARTLTVSFAGPSGLQTHTESGPPLPEVLWLAGVFPSLNTWVAAVGDDNYTATVTPAEQFVGGRPLLLSLKEDGTVLPQPRLVTDGDVKGGRYVSGVVDIYVGTGPAS
jgi:hypothetical protein